TTYTALCRSHTPLHLVRGLLLPPDYALLCKLRAQMQMARDAAEGNKRKELLFRQQVRDVLVRVEGIFKQAVLPFTPAQAGSATVWAPAQQQQQQQGPGQALSPSASAEQLAGGSSAGMLLLESGSPQLASSVSSLLGDGTAGAGALDLS